MISSRLLPLVGCCAMFCCIVWADAPTDNVPLDGPNILRKRCIACHGEDVQESGLRLDSREYAIVGGDSGAIFDSGNINQSLLLQRIKSHDEGTRMPPEGQPLSEHEISAIEDWLQNGMKWSEDPVTQAWKKHWSYQPLRRPPVPGTQNSQWTRNAIDSFVLAGLEKDHFSPSIQADSQTLKRRYYLDVLGLPPPIESLQEQVDWDELVDQLLASPLMGERWARHWLDVVRFAESDGFETNQPRPNAYPYRDYVIEAMNADKPFDQFAREQIAGDQFAQDAATGFLVGGAWDRVKSPDPVLTANQRADELHDMVSTTCSTFLGLTVGCARCHSHKFDPISQKDYYAIKAALAGVQHGERALSNGDSVERTAQANSYRNRLSAIEHKLASLEARVHLGRTVLIDDSSPSFRALQMPTGEAPHAPGTGRGEANQSLVRFELPNLGKQYRWWQADANQTLAAYAPEVAGDYRVWISWGAGWETHSQDARYLIDEDGDPKTIADQHEIATVDQRLFSDNTKANPPNRSLWSGFRNIGIHKLQSKSILLLHSGTVAAPVTADVVVFEPVHANESAHDVCRSPAIRPPVNSRLNGENLEPVTLSWLKFSIEATSDSEPCIDELVCFDGEGNNVALVARPSSSGDFAGNAFHQLQHINDGRWGNEASWISNEPGKGWVMLEFPTPVTIHRIQWSRDGSPEPKYADRVATRYTISASLDGQSWQTIASEGDRLPRNYPHAIAPFQRYASSDLNTPSPSESGESLVSLQEERVECANKLAAVESRRMAYAGRFEMPQPTLRLHRGDPTQPREPVAPAGLEKFGSRWSLNESATDAERRLQLARWIASPDNPLTARVIVNRLWHYHFGTGLVDTPSDFGLNGGRPSHPELLDWLACELVDHNWSLKHIHRLILCSATFRQSSLQSEPNKLGMVPSDRLLARFPPRRLEAEALRDTLLSMVGTLRLEQGGPGFDLFEANTNYVKVYDSKLVPGPDTWRRMVYQMKPRMQLENTFGSFDCPDAGQVAPKRNRSVTPLQALSLFNSPFMVQQAEWFAQRLERTSSEIDQQIVAAFQWAYSRKPDDDEKSMCHDFINRHGLQAFCRAILNSSEWMVIE